MRTKRISLLMAVLSIVSLLVAGTAYASTDANDIYSLVKCVIKAKQMGLHPDAQERIFWEGIAAYSQNDMAKADDLLGKVRDALNWEIANKRKLYQKKFVSANDTTPVSEQNGTVQIWTLISSENGDLEWTKAIKDVSVEPKTKWSPPPENAEKAIVVVYGRGTIAVDGHKANILGGDMVAVPANMPFTLETAGNFPIYVMLSEAYPDVKGSELDPLQPKEKWKDNWLKIKMKSGVTQKDAQAAFDTASDTVQKAKSMGISPLYEAGLCFDIAQKCLTGGNYAGAYSMANIANDWVQRYIQELKENKAMVDSKGLLVVNRMDSDVQRFHNGTCPAYMAALKLPLQYHQLVLPFEILAKERCGPHQHPTEELYYVMNGRGMMMIADPAGKRYFDKNQPGIEINPGTLLFIPPMSMHTIWPTGNASLIHCVAVGSLLDEKPVFYDIKMDVPSCPWTPESWKDAYEPGVIPAGKK